MFKYLLISVVFAPLVVGLLAARGSEPARNRVALRVGWLGYAVLWFGVLYYLRYRWT